KSKDLPLLHGKANALNGVDLFPRKTNTKELLKPLHHDQIFSHLVPQVWPGVMLKKTPHHEIGGKTRTHRKNHSHGSNNEQTAGKIAALIPFRADAFR